MNTTDGHGGEDHLAPVTDLFARRAAPARKAAADEAPEGEAPAVEAPAVEAPAEEAPPAEAPTPDDTPRSPRVIAGFVDGEPVGGWDFDKTPRRDAHGWWVPPAVAAGSWGGPADAEPAAPAARAPREGTGGGKTSPREPVEPAAGTAPPPRTSPSAPTSPEAPDSRPTQSELTNPVPERQPDDSNVVSLWGRRGATSSASTSPAAASPSAETEPHNVRPTVSADVSGVTPLRRASELSRPASNGTRQPLPWSANEPSSGDESSPPARPAAVRPAPKRAPRLRVIDTPSTPDDADIAGPTDDELRESGERTLLKKLRGKGLSISESRSLLRGLGLASEIIDELIDAFVDRGYLNDTTLAEQLVYQAVSRKAQGRRAIAMALSARGIPREIVDAALEEIEDDDDDRALEFARSKARSMASLDREVALRRLLGQLARRGFSGSGAMNAAKTALDEVSGVRFR